MAAIPWAPVILIRSRKSRVSGRAFSTKGNAWPVKIDVFAITVHVRPEEVRKRSLPLFYRGS